MLCLCVFRGGGRGVRLCACLCMRVCVLVYAGVRVCAREREGAGGGGGVKTYSSQKCDEANTMMELNETACSFSSAGSSWVCGSGHR